MHSLVQYYTSAYRNVKGGINDNHGAPNNSKRPLAARLWNVGGPVVSCHRIDSGVHTRWFRPCATLAERPCERTGWMGPDRKFHTQWPHGHRRRNRARTYTTSAVAHSRLVPRLFRPRHAHRLRVPADPVDGFPPGTPDGYPKTVSTSGLIHFAAAGIGFLALAISCFVVGAAMLRRRERRIARLSFLSALLVVFGFLAPALLPASGPVAGIWFSVVVGWAWLTLTCGHLYRQGPSIGATSHSAS
jgi:hypothetical protein